MPKELIKTQDISPIVQMAMKNKFDIAQLDKLIDVQEKFEKIRAEKEYNISFAKFKQNNIIITKDNDVEYGTTSYSHASLANILAIVTPLLSKEGLALSWKTDQDDQGIVKVTAILTHELGHSVPSSLKAKPDNSGGKNEVQAIGSIVTYLERYTTKALLGIAESKDNDGQGANQKELDYITPDQVENLQFEIDSTKRDNAELTKVVCDAYKVPSLQHILSKDFAEILDRITKS